MVQEMQVKGGLALVLDKQRLVAVEGPVREQFESELRELTDAEQDSKYLKSRKRGMLYDSIVEGVDAAVPGLRRGVGREGRDDEGVGQEGGRRGLQGHRPQEDRRRQAPARRSRHGGDPADQRRGRVRPADARLRPVHPRRDADPDALHARHGQGRPADRRPLARAGSPLHPPLQLPALLGRRDRVHAGAEAARHRPRCARAEGARRR